MSTPNNFKTGNSTFYHKFNGTASGISNIPKRKPSIGSNPLSNGITNGTTTPSKIPVNNPEAYKWKQKYEDVELKRKSLLTEKEKALRNATEIEKKYIDLQVKHEHLETELFEKNEEYTKLQTASKNLYKEYEMLKHQYDTEMEAMGKAFKDASQWYKENKELKRRTLLISDKDTVDEGVDAGEATADADLENLNKTIKQLSAEVAELQTEVDSAKQSEFQALELNSKLTEELEEVKKENGLLHKKLQELQNEHNQVIRITEMMKKEIQDLKLSEENHRQEVDALRRAADDYKKERNVLAHQSTLLMQGFNEDSGNDLILLQEVEDLKRQLEDERNKHEEEINALQEKLENQENNSQVEVLEERVKLIEAELQQAIERAEKAEEALKAPPAPPPPPPPPLLPPPSSQPPVVPLRVKRRSRVNVLELAEQIGVQDSPEKKPSVPPAPAAAGVNEDIINAIKEGKFTLKKAKNGNKDGNKKEKEAPKAVSELLNILGSLRRAPKKRQSLYVSEVHV